MKKVLMFVNVDWFFYSHRLPIAECAKKNNINMTVYTDITQPIESKKIKTFKFKQSPLKRVSDNLFKALFEFFGALKLINNEKPDLMHAVTIKPIIVFGIIARLKGIPFLGAVSGLGPGFVNKNFIARLRLKFIKIIYRYIFKSPQSGLICQSDNDANILINLKICDRSKIHMIRGSGVDLIKFSPRENKSNIDPFVLMASRILSDKGVFEYCFAAKRFQKKYGSSISFKLAGPIDNLSPTHITREAIERMTSDCEVEYLGNRSDLDLIIPSANLFVYPSYYPEGIPKILLEAAACGVPILTTDHPGCRDAIVPGETGFIVKPRDTDDLLLGLIKMLSSDSLEKVGKSGRALAEKEFGINRIIDQHYIAYSKYLK